MRVEITPMPGTADSDSRYGASDESGIELSFLSMIGEATASIEPNGDETAVEGRPPEFCGGAPESPMAQPAAVNPFSPAAQPGSTGTPIGGRAADSEAHSDMIAPPAAAPAEPPTGHLLAQLRQSRADAESGREDSDAPAGPSLGQASTRTNAPAGFQSVGNAPAAEDPIHRPEHANSGLIREVQTQPNASAGHPAGMGAGDGYRFAPVLETTEGPGLVPPANGIPRSGMESALPSPQPPDNRETRGIDSYEVQGNQADPASPLFVGCRVTGRNAAGAVSAPAAEFPLEVSAEAELASGEDCPQADSLSFSAHAGRPGAGLGEQAGQENRGAEKYHLAAPMHFGKEGRISFRSEGPAVRSVPSEALALNDPDFPQALAQRVQIQVRGGDGSVQIQLKPHVLGRLEIRAETSGGAVRASIITESQSVKDFLEQNLHVLRQTFQEQGLRVDRVQITVADPAVSEHSSGGGFPHQPHSGRGEESRPNLGRGQGIGQEKGADIEKANPAVSILRPHSTFYTVA